MKGGISFVFFPEGTRSSDGSLLPFKRGGLLLAVKTETPIVPITISGSSAILPKGDWRIRAGEIEVTVGAPVGVEHYRPGNLRVLALRLQELIESNLQIRPQLTLPKPGEKRSTAGVRPSLEKRMV
jgi:1-acyl-sn-glycerol-3-phosphate acyltransferase